MRGALRHSPDVLKPEGAARGQQPWWPNTQELTLSYRPDSCLCECESTDVEVFQFGEGIMETTGKSFGHLLSQCLLSLLAFLLLAASFRAQVAKVTSGGATHSDVMCTKE